MLVVEKEKLWNRWRGRLKLIPILVIGLLLGAGATLLVQHGITDSQEEKYDLLSRRILLENPNDVLLNFRELQNNYESYVASNGLNDSVNLYFEYLPSGSSIGINENKVSTGASLIKLPLVVSFYKLVEEGKYSLGDSVTIKEEWLNSSYGDLYKKGAGYQITYRELVALTLKESDNTAALALFDAVSRGEGTQSPGVLSFVDANYSESDHKEVLIGVQSYSSVLKCVYFACYLSKDNSQSILKDLTESTAESRLKRYLPADVKVAHKIGTFSNTNQSDCGIFYVPKRNYLLCVMVQADDPRASEIIGDLSQITYKFLVPDKPLAIN